MKLIKDLWKESISIVEKEKDLQNYFEKGKLGVLLDILY